MGIAGSLVRAGVLAGVVAMAATGHAQGLTDMKKGEGGSAVQGSAGPGGAAGAASDLERCDKPMGTVAVAEPQDYVLVALSHYRLRSPTGLIRLIIQQSNCFLVVERGFGMQNIMQERALAQGGQLRQGSNMGGGQMVTADYILTPAVVFSEDNAGGVGGAVGGVVGGLFGSGAGRALGAVAGGLKFKEAQTSMLLADARSSLQVAAAEGSAKKADFRLGGLLAGAGAGGGAAGALGGYENTNEGKVIAASLADNYNGIVRAVRGNPSLQRDVAALTTEAGKVAKAGAVFNEGDVLRPKIANVKLLTQPTDQSAAVSTLARGEELIFTGKEQDGFVSVETARGAGWVKKILVTQ
ncbi:MAG TPA: peptidoglycan-binding protein [Methylomirabilota bacterium]|nr:peptidoglycan-binding protein [Methylomirabilota bacterium]